MMPTLPSSSQDELNLHFLNELERLNILMDLLAKRGRIQPEDVALAQLKQDLKHQERLAGLGHGDPKALEALRQRIWQLENAAVA